jgi:hypothetical protein
MKKTFFLALLLASASFSCKKDPVVPPTVKAEATITVKGTTYKFTAPQDHQYDYDGNGQAVYVLHNTMPYNHRYEVYAFNGANTLLFYLLWNADMSLGAIEIGERDAQVSVDTHNYNKHTEYSFTVTDKSVNNFSADFSGTYVQPNGEVVPVTGTLRHLKIFEYK